MFNIEKRNKKKFIYLNKVEAKNGMMVLCTDHV